MTKQIFNEIENMKANNVNVSDMAMALSGKFGMSIEIARQWVTTSALANGLGLNSYESMLYFCAAMVYDIGFLSVNSALFELPPMLFS